MKLILNVDDILFFFPQKSTALQKYLSSQIEKLRNNVKEKDRELSLKDQSLVEAKRQKDATSQKMMQLRQTIKQNNTKTIRLVEEKAEAEKQLQLKKRELQLLHRVVHKDSELLQKDRELLQKDRELLQNLEKEIMELRQRLQLVERELTLERNLSKELRQKLQQATEELAKKSAVERERQEAKEYLKTHLDRERQTVDSLRVQLASKDRHIREVEVQMLLDTL